VAITIHLGELGRPDVEALLALHVAAMRSQSPPDACHVLGAEALADPCITFFTAREDGVRLLGTAALKELGGRAGEIKSMRTAPHALRRGVASVLLETIVAEARRRGYDRLLLETGRSEEFAAANALYERAGFGECGAFGGYDESPFTRFLALPL
jgi:putative acetyltransferase